MSCLICGGSTTKYELPEEDLFVCNDCGYGCPTLQEPIEYTAAYEKKYLAYEEARINIIRVDAVDQALEFCEKFVPRNILDYGCGSGSFVRYARDNNFKAFGFDINKFTSDLRPPLGFTPNIVTAWDSFEHLSILQQERFFITAKHADIIVVSVPDFETPCKKNILGWRHYRPNEHLHYYTAAALCRRFFMEGFVAVFTSHNEDKIRTAPWENNILTIGFIHE